MRWGQWKKMVTQIINQYLQPTYVANVAYQWCLSGFGKLWGNIRFLNIEKISENTPGTRVSTGGRDRNAGRKKQKKTSFFFLKKIKFTKKKYFVFVCTGCSKVNDIN